MAPHSLTHPTARSHLKRKTDAAHRRLDGGMGAFDLRAPRDYARFLAVNAAALIPAETALDAAGLEDALPDWVRRRRGFAIRADLGALGAGCAHTVVAPRIPDLPTAMGAAYVLEGSRLGGRLLARAAGGSDHAAVRDNMRFLRHGDGLPLWQSFLEQMEDILRHPADRDRATAGARAVFAMFQNALDRHMATNGKVDTR